MPPLTASPSTAIDRVTTGLEHLSRSSLGRSRRSINKPIHGPMAESSGISRRSALLAAGVGGVAVALFGVLCLASHELRSGAGLATTFAALSGVGCVAVVWRSAQIKLERAAWLAFALAIIANTLCEVFELSGKMGASGSASSAAGGLTFVLAGIALVLRVRSRLGWLKPIACLDGMTGAIAAQTILGLLILGPAAHAHATAGHSEFAAVLLYPLADVFFLGLVAAATAENGWRSSGWMVIGLALLLMTIGDCISAAHSAHHSSWSLASASVFWLAAVWALALSAWMPVHGESDRRADPSPAVPIALSAIMLTLLLVCTLQRGTWKGTIILAAAGTVIVTIRFGLTLWLNARLLESAKTAATTDVLTGLSNRRQLDLDLDAVLRTCHPERPGCLAIFDLNGFKGFNDALGHPAGDALLTTLGARLEETVGDDAGAYRLGGDEFCVLVRAGHTDIKGVIARAAEALTLTTSGQNITTAAGLALLPQDASTPAGALRMADLRMYEHKYTARGLKLPNRTGRSEQRPGAVGAHEFGLERSKA
jgi:two-component system cell cycle response regulator